MQCKGHATVPHLIQEVKGNGDTGIDAKPPNAGDGADCSQDKRRSSGQRGHGDAQPNLL
jgi:hypothetical protein